MRIPSWFLPKETFKNVESPMENNLMINNDDETLLDISRNKINNTHKSVIKEIENSEVENSGESSNDDIDFTPELEDSSQDNFIEQKRREALIYIENEVEFTGCQQQIMNKIFNVMESMAERDYKLFEDRDLPITLMTGGPGTEKSFCIEKISGLGKIWGIQNIIKSCFMGVAAVNIDGQIIQNFSNLVMGTIITIAKMIVSLKNWKTKKLSCHCCQTV